ncbi:hypothetical protein ACFE04_018755 [Oxalis oulophora]
MKIFSWITNGISIHGNANTKRQEDSSTKREELNDDWPQSLFAIGTFGSIVSEKVKSKSNLVLDSLPETEFENPDEPDDDQDRIDQNQSIVSAKEKDIYFDKNIPMKGIGNKSLSFLVKKVLVCRGGFSPACNLNDQILDSKMDKMLRAMLHKKIYPQSSNPLASNKKKYLSNGCVENSNMEQEEENERTDRGNKWVKTDSEYIVLEI